MRRPWGRGWVKIRPLYPIVQFDSTHPVPSTNAAVGHNRCRKSVIYLEYCRLPLKNSSQGALGGAYIRGGLNQTGLEKALRNKLNGVAALGKIRFAFTVF